jgi:hypothetical protein
LKDITLLSVSVVNSIKLACRVDTYYTRRLRFASPTVILGVTRAIIIILDGSQAIQIKLAILSTVSRKLVTHFFASPSTITSPVYKNCTGSIYLDWAMKTPTPVLRDECFPERLDDDSDDEFDYDCIGAGEMDGSYALLHPPTINN